MKDWVIPFLIGLLVIWLTPTQSTRSRKAAIRSVGALAFPSILFAMLPACDRGCRASVLPIAWVLSIHMLDMHILFRGRSSTDDVASVRLDPQSVTALTFGLCAFLGTRSDSKYGGLFLLAVVGCITAVMPSHNLEKSCVEADVIDSVQKAAIINCIGLLIAGVTMTRLNPSPASL